MKAKALQILWHNKDERSLPVFSVDFHPGGGNVLATGGADKEIKLWTVSCDERGEPAVAFQAALTGCSNGVNVVRFAPGGHALASGGDGGEVLLWQPAAGESSLSADAPWRLHEVLHGHGRDDDVMDLAWSPDSGQVASASVGSSSMVWDLIARRPGPGGGGSRVPLRLAGHTHYVQGVAWDPAGRFLATQSSDRSVRVHEAGPRAGAKPRPGGRGDFACSLTLKSRDCAAAAGAVAAAATAAATAAAAAAANATAAPPAAPTTAADGSGPTTATAPAPAAAPAAALLAPPASAPPAAKPPPSRHALFHDESLKTFFRRLAWAPDGSFLAAPAGVYRRTADGPALNTLYLFARGGLASPAAFLPALSKPAVAVRFCPVPFALWPTAPEAAGVGAAAEVPTRVALGPDGAAAGPSDAAPGAGATSAPSAGSMPAPAPGGGSSPAVPPLFRDLPYRLVYAVATLDSVLIYDTSRSAPLALLAGMHLAALTDLAWSPDGRLLAMASYDGYCSLAAFGPGELGTPLTPADVSPTAAAVFWPRPAAPAPAAAQVPVAAPAPAVTGPAAGSVAAATAVTMAALEDAGRAAGGSAGAGDGGEPAGPAAGGDAPSAAPAAATAAATLSGASRRIAPMAVTPGEPSRPAAAAGPRRIAPQSLPVLGAAGAAASVAASATAPVAVVAPKAPKRLTPEAMGASAATPSERVGPEPPSKQPRAEPSATASVVPFEGSALDSEASRPAAAAPLPTAATSAAEEMAPMMDWAALAAAAGAEAAEGGGV